MANFYKNALKWLNKSLLILYLDQNLGSDQVVTKKDLIKMKKEVIRVIINKEEYDKNSNNKW
jgi:hypothetical protein